ncbi:sugar nucleotide-binding protein [bacterium]|nr:sugar nucleotide-binding protein [bacterium]
MITLLGSTGYIGQAFAAELNRRGLAFEALTRSQLDYTRFEDFLAYLRRAKPAFVINAAGYTGKPNVDACETAKADTLQGNTLFPAMLGHACAATDTPWGHVSSGCIYSGAKVVEQGVERIEPDLTKPNLREHYRSSIPLSSSIKERAGERSRSEAVFFRGFTETDTPNFSFRSPPCSFYSGTKALGEEAIAGVGRSYIWRLRIPFDEFDNARNYLSKVQRYSKVYDNVNSISHRRDFVAACIDTWEKRVPFGTYNVTNPGAVTTRQVVEAIQRILKPDRSFEFWESDEEFYKVAAKTPRSNCIMDVSKILGAGIKIRSVEEALEDSLRNWQPETK